MASKSAKKIEEQTKRYGLAVKPGLITLALTLGWGAYNQPPVLTVETTLIWALTMGAVALISHGAMMFFFQLSHIIMAQAHVAFQQMRKDHNP